jgi:RimJ/RimL family protein N-acetyltransferase
MTKIMTTTRRLELIAGTEAIVRAEMKDRSRFARLLNAQVPEMWPPELNNDETIAFSLQHLEQAPDQAGWWVWYVILCYEHAVGRVLIGNGGFKGKPAADGSVEIGYAMLPGFQNTGYATEAVGGLVAWAFQQPAVQRVTAETLPMLKSSLRVLEKNGFVQVGEMDDGTLRFELMRDAYAALCKSNSSA